MSWYNPSRMQDKVAFQSWIPSALQTSGFHTLLWTAPIGIGFCVQRVIHDVNAAFCALCGYLPDELVGYNVKRLYETEAEYDRIGRIKYPELEANGWAQVESRWRRKDGTVIDVSISSAMLQPGDFSQGVAFMVQDISDRKHAERALLIQSARWYELFQDSPEGIVLMDADFKFLVANTEFARMFGFTDADLAQCMPRLLLVPEDLCHEGEDAITRLSAGETVRFEKTIRLAKDGTRVPVSVLSKPIRIDENNVGIYSIYRDISEQIAAENALRHSLTEKEVLLQEVHHRVKNNLNIINSLLSLQALESNTREADEPLALARSRVHSMAMIHDLLYRSKNLAEVPFKLYLEDLVGYLRSAFFSSNDNVAFILNIESVGLDINTAVPCGLLVNEIIVNSMKHAFPERRPGTVSLTLSSTHTHSVLCVQDDGIGLPEHIDFERATSMGLELIRGLTAQLGAELHRDFTNGTRYTIVIPKAATSTALVPPDSESPPVREVCPRHR
jgi:PAS domain S-box-containing protein